MKYFDCMVGGLRKKKLCGKFDLVPPPSPTINVKSFGHKTKWEKNALGYTAHVSSFAI